MIHDSHDGLTATKDSKQEAAVQSEYRGATCDQ